jgi:beta-lactam-binding protein with PASTA domain
MPVTDSLINTLFDGRYRIVRKLGTGGMADVYLAEDQELGRRVAIKILNDKHAADEQFVERFRREAKSAAGLSHPNIVSIYDRGEAEGTYYIAMEHLDGRNLKELLLSRGPAPPHIAIDYARQILSGMRFAHRNGIVHRDIKPHNVLVDGDGRLKVTDFGIARAGGTQMTEAGSIVGTAQYLSPEQARGSPVDQRSDLYSLGIVLYELLTGTVPFTGDTPVEIAMKHLSEIPVPPSELNPAVPKPLEQIVMRALAKDPDDRYQSAEEMESDLDRVARGERVAPTTSDAATSIMAAARDMPTSITHAAGARTGITDYQPPRPPPAVMYDYDDRPPRRRRSVWPWFMAVLLVAAAIVGGFLAYDQIRDQVNASRPVTVPFVEGVQRQLAVARIRDAGLKPEVSYEFSDDVRVGHVIRQDPEPGNRIERGNVVELVVSYGRERVEVPDVVGESRDDAVAALVRAGLEPRTRSVPSERPPGSVTAQDPRAGSKVPKDSRVFINVSSGPQQVAVPNVVGQPFEDASAILQQAGFSVARRDVEDDAPAGIVVGQSPAGNGSASRGSSVTLQISQGPSTVEVNNVEGTDRASAVATLESQGFKVKVTFEDTTEPALDGVVVRQSPKGGTQSDPGATISLTVGRFKPDVSGSGEQTDTNGQLVP